jgi:hypothetical protein
LAARPLWGGASQQFFDAKAGEWKNMLKSFGFPAPWSGKSKATFKLPAPAPNADIAGQQNDGAGRWSGYMGDGTIIINCEPSAKWQTQAVIVGVRPGVDGTYLIHNAHHVWSRQGYITQLHVGPNMSVSGPAAISSGYGFGVGKLPS